MVKIVSDSSTLFSVKQGEECGIKIAPLSVTIENKTYREFEEIDAPTFLEKIKNGGIPSSSQPSIGEKTEIYESLKGDEIIDLTMADGLSGTYQSALTAKEMMEHKDDIHVINTKTLCGPHRYMVQKAIELAKEGKDAKTIIEILKESIHHGRSFLIPSDFAFLKRGGRLSPLAAALGGLIRIVPIMELSEDGKTLNKFGVKKTIRKAADDIINVMVEDGVDDSYDVSISHADHMEWVKEFETKMKERLNLAKIKIYELSPAFITQGGPGCIAIQYCKK